MQQNFFRPYIFWTIVIIITLLVLFFNASITSKQNIQTAKKIIQEQSLLKDEHPSTDYIIDLDKIESAKTEDDFIVKDVQNLSLTKRVENLTSSQNIFTLVYGFMVSVLFVYREKYNRKKILQLENVEDTLNMQLAEKNTKIYSNINEELELYKELIKEDLNTEVIDLQTRLENEPKYLIIASKNIVEQIVTNLYKQHLNLDNENLNVMLLALYKKRVLNHSAHNYAQIIKAFGNKANHTSKKFNTREATLAISNLIEFLKELDKANVLKGIDV